MRLVVGDLESFFDRKGGYTLDKITTESYLRDPRFEMHGISVKWSASTSAQWYDEREWRHIAKNEDWSDTLFIFHHAQFDGLALSHHYDVHPKMLGCTLSMARLLLGNHLSVSLDNVRKHFGMPSKRTPYHLFDGKHWSELTPTVQQELAAGCCDETESIWTIFGLLMKQGFPREELEVIDLTLKMFTEPRLVADIPLLKQIWLDEAIRKKRAMADLGVTEAELQSAEKFAELLRAEGVEIGYKPSPKHPDKTIYAFAKTDQFMRDLLDDPDERIRTLAEARLGQKSNITQTRAETFARMARRGPMCVYLNYAGAGTLRPSGGDGCLTAETQILTLDISGTPKYKNIIDVLVTDLVWDGEEFVGHEGVAFSGYKEVVTWDGVNGTPDHQVRCGAAWKSLSEALRDKTPILDCREPTTWEVEAARSRQRTRS